MRGFFARNGVVSGKVLLVESCSREEGERALRSVCDLPEISALDLLTCYPDAPRQFDASKGTLHSVHQPDAVADRNAFARRLAAGGYDAIVVPCTGSGVLAKWKWNIVARTGSPVVVYDEGELFYADVHHRSALAALLARRLNLGSLPHALFAGLKLLAIPFTILFLICFTVDVHVRRWWRLRKKPDVVESRT